MLNGPVVRNKSKNLSTIDEMFRNLKAKVSVTSSLEGIKRCLMKEFSGVRIESINIVENRGKFYGMRTFYSTETITENTRVVRDVVERSTEFPELKKQILKSKEVLKAKATSVPVLHIEIDPELLYSKIVTLQGEELTAILLHEVGHFGIHASDFFDKVKLSILLSISKWGARMYAILRVFPYSVIKGLFILIVSELVLQTRLLSARDVEETLADRFVIDQGYGLQLESAMGKLLEARLAAYKSKQLVSEEKDIYDKTEVILSMSVHTFSQLNGRREEIRRVLNLSKDALDSPIYKMYVDSFLGDIFEKMHPARLIDTAKQTEVIREQLEVKFIQMNENLFRKLLGWEKTKFSEKDLDSIRIDIEMITDYDDKIDVVDRIHRNISALEKAIEALSIEIDNDITIDKYQKEKKNRDINTLRGYIKTLKGYKDQAMAIKIVDKEYGVFVKTPKGYEG